MEYVAIVLVFMCTRYINTLETRSPYNGKREEWLCVVAKLYVELLYQYWRRVTRATMINAPT